HAVLVIIFFFQAEDGIRDRNVTGVQTCALPISWRFPRCATPRDAIPPYRWARASERSAESARAGRDRICRRVIGYGTEDSKTSRSEERRVGKEVRGVRGGEGSKVEV